MAKVLTTLVCLDIKVSPKMPRAKSNGVSEVIYPVSHHNESGFSGESTVVAEIYRALKGGFDKIYSYLETAAGEMSKTKHRLAGLQPQVQQPRFTGKADVNQDKKTRERKESVVL